MAVFEDSSDIHKAPVLWGSWEDTEDEEALRMSQSDPQQTIVLDKEGGAKSAPGTSAQRTHTHTHTHTIYVTDRQGSSQSECTETLVSYAKPETGPTRTHQGFCLIRGTENHGNHGNWPRLYITEIPRNQGNHRNIDHNCPCFLLFVWCVYSCNRCYFPPPFSFPMSSDYESTAPAQKK